MVFIGVIIGVVIGFIGGLTFVKVFDKVILQKQLIEKIEIFKDILNSVNKKQIKFGNRVNGNVGFSVLTSRVGLVELIYSLDRSDLAIFQKGHCLHTSKDVDSDIISKICLKLNHRFKKDINDVTNIQGNIIDNKTIKKLTSNINDMAGDIMGISVAPQEPQFDLDDILDKISKDGIKSLSKEERVYLDSLNDDT